MSSSVCFDSPRIRGDGPRWGDAALHGCLFSPYSRGWSLVWRPLLRFTRILPVFAGMVLLLKIVIFTPSYSPRIRGDGPRLMPPWIRSFKFSPYSRGWSPLCYLGAAVFDILPVFAGMVPARVEALDYRNHSPRIRGDGPDRSNDRAEDSRFSPYSRGWSHFT